MSKSIPTYDELAEKILNLQNELESVKKELREKNDFSRTTMDHMLEGCQIIGTDWKYKYLNDAAIKHSTLSREQLIGKNFTDIWPGIEKTKVYSLIHDCIKTGKQSHFDNKFVYPDGKFGWFDTNIQRIPEGIFVMSIDITEKKAIEENLIINEKKFRTVFESANVGKSITLPNGQLNVNQAFCNILGYSKKELESKKWKDITPKEEIPLIEKKLAPIYSGKKNKIRFVKRYIHKKGNYVWVDISLVMHRNTEGNPMFFIATIIDITKQKETEKEVLYQKELLEEMGEIAKIGAWEFDPTTEEVIWTDEVARIHELKPGNKTNVEIGLNFYNGESRALIEKAVFDVVNKRKPYKLELQFTTAKGNKKWIRTYGKPIVKNKKVVKVRGSFQDITEKKVIEEKLKNSELTLKTLLTNLPGVAYRCKNNITWDMDFLSDGCYALTGYNSDELIQNSSINYSQLIHPDDKNYVWNTIQAKINLNEPFEIEYRIITKKNNLKWVWERGKKVSDTPEMLEGFISDITDRKKTEYEKDNYMVFLNTIIEQSPFAMWVSDTNGYITRTNNSLKEILDTTDSEIIGKYNVFNDSNLIEQDKIHKVEKVFKEKTKTRFVIYWKSTKMQNISFDKEQTLWIDVSLFPILDKDNNLINVVCQWIDITNLKKAEEILKVNENRLKKAQFIAKIGNYIWDIENDKINLSESLLNLLNLKTTETFNLEQIKKIIHHPEDSDKIMNWMQSNLASNSNILTPFEYRILKNDGTTIYVRAMGEIKRKNKKPIEVIATIQDITESKLAEMEIHKLNSELENRVQERTAQLDAKNKELQTFAYSVSHDLKAPLRGIDGYSKLLSEMYGAALNNEAKVFIANIRHSTLQMNQLIEDLLSYTRLERSSIEKVKIQGNLFISGILNSFRKDLKDSNTTIRIKSQNIHFYADKNSLAMVLRNIIDNAIKFSKGVDNPEIIIETKEKENSIIIIIKDNGIGFDNKFNEKIFGIFQRLQRSEDYPGTGIGLAMVYKAVLKMNGKIWATGHIGKGSSFFIEIPKNN